MELAELLAAVFDHGPDFPLCQGSGYMGTRMLRNVGESVSPSSFLITFLLPPPPSPQLLPLPLSPPHPTPHVQWRELVSPRLSPNDKHEIDGVQNPASLLDLCCSELTALSATCRDTVEELPCEARTTCVIREECSGKATNQCIC